MTQFDRLVAIMARLRAPGGCPWDAQQTHQSLRPYLLEEAYEVLEAIDEGDLGRLSGELGDLLLQVVFHAQVARDEGLFDIEDVCRKIADKLEYRHPHVFGDVTVRDADEVLTNWEALKRTEAEHKTRESALDGVPKHLPALQQADELQKKAAKVGFDWQDYLGPLAKIDEELQEVREAQEADDQAGLQHEIGDLLFAVCNYARFLKVDPESALREANKRFSSRFRDVEAQAKAGEKPLAQMTLAEMDVLWEAAKARERGETLEEHSDE
ncbi:MAG: nucleoside triphosphate pyrophosphohydrolase, partial [Bacteroidota bacterium]